MLYPVIFTYNSQLSGLTTTKAALKKNGLNCLRIIYTNVKHTYFTAITKQRSQTESLREWDELRLQLREKGSHVVTGRAGRCAMAALCVCIRVCKCKLLGCRCWRDLCICECCKCMILSLSPFISWLLSPAFLWPGEDRCSALTLSSD